MRVYNRTITGEALLEEARKFFVDYVISHSGNLPNTIEMTSDEWGSICQYVTRDKQREYPEVSEKFKLIFGMDVKTS